MKKFRLPRKIKKQIPQGPYCYKGLNFDMDTGIYHIKPCPFYTHIQLKDKPKHLQYDWEKEFPNEYSGWCKLIKYEIDDQCKSCSIKTNYLNK